MKFGEESQKCVCFLVPLCVADMYLLSEGPEAYHYLSQSGCVQDSSLDDKQLFDSVMVRRRRQKAFFVCVCVLMVVSPPEGAITLYHE